MVSKIEQIIEEIEELIDCVLHDRPVPTDGREGASTVAVGAAIVESAAIGDKVAVNYDF